MKVKLLKKHGDYKEGDAVEFSDVKGKRLIRNGEATQTQPLGIRQKKTEGKRKWQR